MSRRSLPNRWPRYCRCQLIKRSFEGTLPLISISYLARRSSATNVTFLRSRSSLSLHLRSKSGYEPNKSTKSTMTHGNAEVVLMTYINQHHLRFIHFIVEGQKGSCCTDNIELWQMAAEICDWET